MPTRVHRLLIPFAAFCAILPILITGPSCGHDFDFHLLSWLEASTQFAHVHYPHWAYTPAYNAGEPRFIFYPPLSWSLGALLGLILPWKLVPAAFTWIALTLSGFTMHRFARRYSSANAATFAAVLYLANPYMLFTAYERTAYGELLAAAWLPLLFAAALAAKIRIVPLAIPIALLWLTNAPAAVMSCYALAFVTLLRLTPLGTTAQTASSSEVASRKPGAPSQTVSSSEVGLHPPRLHTALTTLAATLLGLTLSAFYLVPAIAERPYIQSEMATIEGMRIVDNTLFHHMSPTTDDNIAHDVVLDTASLISVTLLAAILLTLLVPHPRSGFIGPGRGPQRAAFARWVGRVGIGEADLPRGQHAGTNPNANAAPRFSLPSSLFPLPFLALLIAFLLTPLSLPIWNHIPELRFLQFPWRLTAILGTILALFAARAYDRIFSHRKPTLPSSLFPLPLVLALILPAWHLFHQPCEEEDTVEARVALYHSPLGTEPTDEYTPTNADNDSLSKTDPPYWFIPASEDLDSPPPSTSAPGPLPNHFGVTLPAAGYVVLNRRDFREWQIFVNGTPQREASPVREDGLISLKLPAGTYRIDLILPPRIALTDFHFGLILTAIALLIALVVSRPSNRIRSGP